MGKIYKNGKEFIGVDTTYRFGNTADGWAVTNNSNEGTFYHVDKGTHLANIANVRQTMKRLFVDGDMGDDSNPGTVAQPFKTIQRAISEIAPVFDRSFDYPAYGLTDAIYVNCSATDPYGPVYIDHGIIVSINSYDPSRTTSETDIFIDNPTATLRIVANAYDHPTIPGARMYPNCWYQRGSVCYFGPKGLNLTQGTGCIATAMYVGMNSIFDWGTDNDQNLNLVPYTLTINANQTAVVTGRTRLDPSTGKTIVFDDTTASGCEGLGVHNRSRCVLRGLHSAGARINITASNWAMACSDKSVILVRPSGTWIGGSNLAANSGGMYASIGSTIIFEGPGQSTSNLIPFVVRGDGKGAAISCTENSVIRGNGTYFGWTIDQTRSDCAGACVAVGMGGILSLRGYKTMHIKNMTKTQRCIQAYQFGRVTIYFPQSSVSGWVAEIIHPTDTSGNQQALGASEGAEINLWGGTGTTSPKITGRIGYGAYNGARLTYANAGAFTGTTQFQATGGGRIYSGNQSSIPNY